ncbi:hypothetical protein PINS_up023557 [Pythium insidiosum]|nr:hypothetical protein PINS_up023557 [Pythium insidiosum]
MPNYLLFDDVICDIYNIDVVELVESTPTMSGTAMSFQFSGSGLQDFDVAKWVDSTAASKDNDCDTLAAVGGSTSANVIGNTARFQFSQQTSSMALCYQFKGKAFKLFASVPIRNSARLTPASSDSSSSTVDDQSAVQFVPNRNVATVSLRLDKDITDLPPGSPQEAAFKTAFTNALSASLKIDPARIQIIDLIAGSVVVNFKLLPSDNVADPLVHEVLQDLQTQIQTPGSALLQAPVIQIKDAATALTSVITSSPAPAPAPVAIAARAFQRNGVFTFEQDAYSVTERDGQLVVRVQRLQGTDAVVTVPFRIDAGTTTFGQDFRFASDSSIDPSSPFLTFGIGEREKEIKFEIVDDSEIEAHFEYFKIILGDPAAPDTVLGDAPLTIVRIFDYDDGNALVSTNSGWSNNSSRRFKAGASSKTERTRCEWTRAGCSPWMKCLETTSTIRRATSRLRMARATLRVRSGCRICRMTTSRERAML